MHKKMIYLGGGRDIVNILKKADELGIELHYIQKPELFDKAVLPYVRSFSLFDYDDFHKSKELFEETFDRLRPDSIFSLNENGVVAAAYYRELYGITGNSYVTSQRLRNKFMMREHLKLHNFSSLLYSSGSSESDLFRFFDQCSEFIVKPVDASGSFSIFKVSSSDQIFGIWRLLSENRVKSFIMEEYLNGPELSVETFTQNGKHHVLSVTEKLTGDNFVETGHVVPGRFNTDFRRLVSDFTAQFLDIMSFASGPAHTEIKFKDGIPHIVESHDRTGGDRINDLVCLATGMDMRKLALAQAAGIHPVNLEEMTTPSAAVIRYCTPPSGQLLEIIGIESARTSPNVRELTLSISEGEIVRPLRESGDRVGFVISTGDTPESALSSAEKALRVLNFKISN